MRSSGSARCRSASRCAFRLAHESESVDIEGTPASDVFTKRNFTPVSGSLGVVFDASKTTRLGVTLTSAARAPAQTELFARGPHDGPGTFETGDPTLGEERANSLEGTLRFNSGKALTLEGALWIAKFSNYIYGNITGRTCDGDGNCVADDSLDLKELNLHAGGRDVRRRGRQGVVHAREHG